MNKTLLFSLLFVASIHPVMAEVDIASGATDPSCDSSVLHTTDGPATLQANWSANTINLKWYSDNTEITDVQNTSKTCTYDGTITLPATNPEKTGYTFSGWQVIQIAQCDLSTLNTITDADSAFYKYTNSYGPQCIEFYYDEDQDSWSRRNVNCNTDSRVSGMTSGRYNGQWRVVFNHGTVEGEALCSTTNGTYHKSGNPDTSSVGQRCWCGVTGYTPNNGHVCNVASTLWVFYYGGYESASVCEYDCVRNCAGHTLNSADFRSAVYGITQ